MGQWIKDNNDNLIYISQKEYFERMTRDELVNLCLEYYHELYYNQYENE